MSSPFPRAIPAAPEFDVAVAGAGPVGAAAALALAQRGARVLLLEAEPQPPVDLRASTFHPSSLEMLDSLGIAGSMLAEGLIAPVYQYRIQHTGEILSFDLGEIADRTRFPFRLQLEQWRMARMAVARLAQYQSAEVRTSARLVHLAQDERAVTLSIERPNAIEEVRASFLVAADGASSITRKWLGIGFPGFTWPERFLCLSTDWPLEQHFLDLAHVNYVADAQSWRVLLRTPSLWRVLVPGDGEASDEALLSEDMKNQVFDTLTGDGRRVKTGHRTIYRVHQRVAERFVAGRVALAGDAAHINNPLGGLGMNSGIHDALCLADTLARALAGGDHGALFERYDEERRGINLEFVQAQTIRNKRMLESADGRDAYFAEVRAIHADPRLRRDYLLAQSMLRPADDAAASSAGA